MSTLLENIIVNLRVFFAKGTHKLLKWFLLALLALTVLDAIVLIDPINRNYTRYEVPCTGYFGHVDVSGLQSIEKDYLVLAYDAKKIKGGEDIKIKNVLVYNKYTKEILSDFYNINYKITKSSNGELYYEFAICRNSVYYNKDRDNKDYYKESSETIYIVSEYTYDDGDNVVVISKT